MSENFILCLQNKLLIYINQSICKVPEIYALIKQINFKWDKDNSDKWKLLSEKAKQIVATLQLPPQIEERILGILRPIALEISRWRDDHDKILSPEINANIFQWKNNGTIERVDTAITIIKDTNLDIRKKFVLACLYSLEDDISHLWNKMSTDDKLLVFEVSYSSIVQFWVSIMQGKTANWMELVSKCLHPVYRSNFINYQNDPIWLRGFFDKLPTKEQQQCLIFSVKNFFKDHDNVRFCLSKINISEQRESFKNDLYRILRIHLDWPLQDSFIKIANQMWDYLSKEQFCDILYFIIYGRIIHKWNDYDYISLLRQFWQYDIYGKFHIDDKDIIRSGDGHFMATAVMNL
ncbi:uncharacterized protein CDAR_313491 [Caerostris darwini]|uniref:Uncharacterized protein n=1 Tax=Caerostris darwini TaxID=1538125 RepID=A0AAV4N0R3_9ARAC|nr:uncharacterized protein CDAR_313491 [Caerostris darwini]